MAKTMAGVLAVSIAALLFAGCGGGESKWTDSKCTEISKELAGLYGPGPFKGSGVKTKAIGFKRVQVAETSVESFDKSQKFQNDHPGIANEFLNNCESV